MSDSSEDPLTPSPENTHVQTMSLGSEPAAIPYSVKLNGVNYSLWSQVVETFVASRGKFGYSIGKTPNPSTDDASYDRWSMENDIVKGWLIGAMEPDLMNLYVRLPIAKSIWTALSHTYYEGADNYL